MKRVDMIDIHTHIIYGVDDGPKNIDESLRLIKKAYRQGVRCIVATSHRRQGMFFSPEWLIHENFLTLKKRVSNMLPDLSLFYGAEYYYSDGLLEQLRAGDVVTLNDTNYILVEFSYQEKFEKIKDSLIQIIQIGYIPIIAHIERYESVAFNKVHVMTLMRLGVVIQVNTSSLLKIKWFKDKHKIRKRRAQFLLKENLIQVIASDMHNLSNRKPYMAEIYAKICKKIGKEIAVDLFIDNPKKIISGEKVNELSHRR